MKCSRTVFRQHQNIHNETVCVWSSCLRTAAYPKYYLCKLDQQIFYIFFRPRHSITESIIQFSFICLLWTFPDQLVWDLCYEICALTYRNVKSDNKMQTNHSVLFTNTYFTLMICLKYELIGFVFGFHRLYLHIIIILFWFNIMIFKQWK